MEVELPYVLCVSMQFINSIQRTYRDINQIDIGKVYSVQEEFSDYLADDEVIHGCFRYLKEFLPQLAKYYLQIKNKRHEALNWFGQTEGTFFWLHSVAMVALLEETKVLVLF